MDPLLREKLLALPGMPVDEAGNPPIGFFDRSRNAENHYEFGLNEEGKAVFRITLALDGRNMHPNPDLWGRTYVYELDS